MNRIEIYGIFEHYIITKKYVDETTRIDLKRYK